MALAGNDPDTTFYAPRHACISHALKAGRPAKAVADHCGTSLRMIETSYAKFTHPRGSGAVVPLRRETA